MDDDNKEYEDKLQDSMLSNLVDVRNAKNFALNIDNLVRAVYMKTREGLDVATDLEAIVEYSTRNYHWLQSHEQALLEGLQQTQEITTTGSNDDKPVIH